MISESRDPPLRYPITGTPSCTRRTAERLPQSSWGVSAPPVLVPKDTTTTSWQIACRTAEFRSPPSRDFGLQWVINRSSRREAFSSGFQDSGLPRASDAARNDWFRRWLIYCARLAAPASRCMSGRSAGCGPMTLVNARQAQISSLQAGGLPVEPPTPTAPMNWLPLITIGNPPPCAKFPCEYCRIS